jgi:hypothetical protein
MKTQASVEAPSRSFLKVWKTITLRTFPVIAELCAAVKACAKMEKYTEKNLSNTEINPTMKELRLLLVSAQDLGLDFITDYLDDVCERATSMGLQLCPHEAALQLRVDYKDQPEGEFIFVATELISGVNKSAGWTPCLYVLDCTKDSGLWIDLNQVAHFEGRRASDKLKFVFALP